MRFLGRPPQFPQGKTATAIDEMALWFLDRGQIASTHILESKQKFKRIVHLIFVNNNLIEGEQWNDRLMSRGIQKMRIFSSKSDVTDTANLQRLIVEGEHDAICDTYMPIDYVMMCTHPTRLSNIGGDGDAMLKRMERFHPDIGFVLWFDEIDRFPKLLTEYIKKFQKFSNVTMMTGITATPYDKFWSIMHECGYYDIELVGELPDPKDYRTIKDHNLLYTDAINIKSPVKNFRHLLEHPGEVMYNKDDLQLRVPNLDHNHTAIMFVPGESRCSTHIAIKDIAVEFKKNALVINGKVKGFFLAGRTNVVNGYTPHISIRDYKKEQIAHKRSCPFLKKPFSQMTDMDVAVSMYNDRLLGLKDKDLVITGFNCVERGVTFNRPNFQFGFVVFSGYHYQEGSAEIESIIQLAGRAFGNKDWVPTITILSPKPVLDIVEKNIQNFITFLRTNPKRIQYADIYRETNGIPIMIRIIDAVLLQRIGSLGKMKDKNRKELMGLLVDGVASGNIIIVDHNHPDKIRKQFSLSGYELTGLRKLEAIEKAKNYRFPEFYDHHMSRKVYGQTVKNRGEFTIDLTMIPLTLKDDTILERGTGFISFAYLPA